MLSPLARIPNASPRQTHGWIRLALPSLSALGLALACPSAHAERLYALVSLPEEAGYRVVSFDSSNPSNLLTDVAVDITFPTGGGALSDLASSPETGELFTASASCPVFPSCTAGLVRVDPETGMVTPTQVPLSFTFPFFPVDIWSFDIEPQVLELRVIDTEGANYRFDLASGALLGEETLLPPSFTAAGIAYAPAAGGASTLFGVGALGGVDQLVRIGGVGGNPSPNGGEISVIGPLGYPLADASFDISRSGIGFTMARIEAPGRGQASDELARIDIETGSAVLLGPVGGGLEVVGIAVASSSGSATLAVPTLEGWGLLFLALLLAAVGLHRLR